MKIVGTKLDDSECERFEDFCIKEGKTKSEILRFIIREYCRACEDEEDMERREKEKTIPKPTVTIANEEPPLITKYKLLDDNGNAVYDSTKRQI